MFSLCFAIFTITAGRALAGYADSSGNSANEIGQGTSNGYGFSGSFSGTGPPPNFPQFDFSGFLGNYLESLNRYHQEFIKRGGGAFSYSYASSSPTATAKAQSSITFKRKHRLQATAQGAQGGYGQPGGFSSGFGGSFGGGNGGAFGGSFGAPEGGSFSYSSPQGTDGTQPSTSGSYGGSTGGGFGAGNGGALATAALGPTGVQQTAAVFPENPNSPNINTRFGVSDTSGQPGGFRSVFTSSQSRTSNVDGKPVTLQQASTTVNDNGKITTYTAKNP